jgi:hypothetical protein
LRPFITWVGLLVVVAILVVVRDGWTLGRDAGSGVSRPVTAPRSVEHSATSVS